jgi:hypothetical protein
MGISENRVPMPMGVLYRRRVSTLTLLDLRSQPEAAGRPREYLVLPIKYLVHSYYL